MRTSVSIREGAPDDASECAAIKNAWIDETPWMPRIHSPEDVERHYRDVVLERRRVFLAEDGSVIGYLALDEEEGFVTSLFLANEARGRGVGKRLLDKAKETRPEGLSLWTFIANTDARRFYRREGFVEDARTDGDNEEGLPDMKLMWPA